MVNVVADSFAGFDYRGINRELARENGELKQQLSQVMTEFDKRIEEIHRRDIQIIDLKGQIDDLAAIKRKYNSIVNIVLDKGNENILQSVEIPNAIEGVPHELSKEIAALPPSCDTSIDISTFSASENEASVISRKQIPTLALNPINEQSGEEQCSMRTPRKSFRDSLDPPEVTSVPQLLPEKIIHTPSIWNIFDVSAPALNEATNGINPIASPIQPIGNNANNNNNNNNNSHTHINNNSTNADMFSSTPVQKKGRGRKRQPAKRDVVVSNEPEPAPSRYNLRKRAKK